MFYWIIGQQWWMWIVFVEVFYDYCWFVQCQVVIDQGWYVVVGVDFCQYWWIVVCFDIDYFYCYIFFGQDQVDVMVVMIGRVGIVGQFVD